MTDISDIHNILFEYFITLIKKTSEFNPFAKRNFNMLLVYIKLNLTLKVRIFQHHQQCDLNV